MKKAIIFLTQIILLTTNIYAQQVSLLTAIEVAEAFTNAPCSTEPSTGNHYLNVLQAENRLLQQVIKVEH